MDYDCVCEAGKLLFDPDYIPQHEIELWGRWMRCESCQDFWCLAHEEHVFECSCPTICEVQGMELN